MIVTKITELSKSRIQITTDEEFAFVLYKGELRFYHLAEGQEIPEPIYKELMEQVLPKRAKLRAMNLLKARPYTVRQLTDKLKQGGYPDSIVEKAVSYVKSYGYLDDRRYASDYTETYKTSKSRAKIKNSLLQKGIDKQIIEECMEEIYADDTNDLEREQINRYIKKKNFNVADASFEEKQKFSAFLYRKGFQIDAIRNALSLDITSI